ncbi:uncharacterized protein At4g38062-like [Malania oleifera]|uniref:uncharacterized protein At4g38062-like n=1 Tax=Malania oleifera TaxID=397392 RepID=UPI0025AE780A|nr:uncharacterized protein At4g38062-like [Malania oleifera]XP_057976491.1 uncharacterized protein At4g38062-like [Malania oleifera]
MDGLHRELDEIKVEREKLKAEYIVKAEICERLRKAHSEQLDKFRNVDLVIEKQAKELGAKSEEIFEMRKKYEDLKSSLCEKESSLKHLISMNEKLTVDCSEKLQKLEGENRELEKKVRASDQEIEGLKRFLLNSERKQLEAGVNAQAAEELTLRDGIIIKLEEENREVQYQLKWKNEQFKHLEEVLKMVKDQFSSSKKGWEREKSALLEEISILQKSLNSQSRISEGLKTQLMMCNQALSHEESRRKLLEVQVSEFSLHFENVYVEYLPEAKSKTDCLTSQRNEEIASLRNSMGTKDTCIKDMEFRIMHLEQVNQELRRSLKELKEEVQTNKAGADSSLMKLHNKFQCLEEVHNNCSLNLKATEAEWSFRLKQLEEAMNCHISEVKQKSKQVQELQSELESCHASIEVLNEEISLVLVVLKSESSEAYAKLLNAKAEVELRNKEKKATNLLLTKQLKMKNSNLNEALVDLVQEPRELPLAGKRVQSFNYIEQPQMFLKEDPQRHQILLEDSTGCQLHLKEPNLERAQMKDRRDFSKVLETSNSELPEKALGKAEIEIGLQKCKLTPASVKDSLKEKEEIIKQVGIFRLAQEEIVRTLEQEKENLIHTGKEHEKKISDLEQQIVFLETAIAEKVQLIEVVQREKETYLQIAEEKDDTIKDLHREIDRLKQESMRRELHADNIFDPEKEKLLDVIKDKEQSIVHLQTLVTLLEKDLTNAVICAFSEVTEKQVEIKVLSDALEKVEYEANLEVQEKNKKVVELEREVNDLGHKLKFQKESLSHSKPRAEQLEASLETNMLKTKQLEDQIVNERRHLEGLLKKLELEKRALIEDIAKLRSERDNMLFHAESICDWISDFSCDDVKMMEMLEKILKISEEGKGLTDLADSDGLCDSTREDANISSPARKKLEESREERWPLKELNHYQLQ